MDASLAIEEIGRVIKGLAKNKALGTDGIPIDFIKVFYVKLKHFLFGLYQEIIRDQMLHLSGRRGIISLLEKMDKDPLLLNNWRPLSLLNADYKIYSKCLANRMQEVLPDLIHPSQTGLMKNRYLGENIIKIQELMYAADIQKTDGIIISFDFYKAFDSVEWGAIQLALEKFGFGQEFRKMVAILYEQPLSCGYNNGSWSRWFPLTISTRQGCCFSPLIFNLVVECLGVGIRQNIKIKRAENW